MERDNRERRSRRLALSDTWQQEFVELRPETIRELHRVAKKENLSVELCVIEAMKEWREWKGKHK